MSPKHFLPFAAAALLALTPLVGCDAGGTDDPNTSGATVKGSVGKSDASAEAVFVDIAFDGELWTSHCFDARNSIQDQLLFTVGQLNGHRSVGRLDQLSLSDIQSETVDGQCHITYSARMPVAWGKKNNVPARLEIVLPRDVSYAGSDAFADTYGHSCVDWGAHDVDAGSMWYYFRPERSGCSMADTDVIRPQAVVSPSPIQTTGKFPEYHKVWEDDALRVVAVFGKYKDGATSGDAGIDAYNRFVDAIGDELRPHGLTTTPETVPANPGVALDDIVFEATLPDGKRVEVVTLLVDNVRTAGPTFNARYEGLSERADLLVYNGHAGLGANIRALAQKGSWVQGQYVIVFMNGCDTYAYVDQALAEAHADVNPDDPEGTKYVDIVTNAMPSFFRSMANATMAMVRGLMSYDAPRTYEQIFTDIDQAEVVLVSGEHDNVFVPGAFDDDGGSVEGEPVVEAWAGLEESGTVLRDEDIHFETPRLPAGRYRFDLSGTGDADLYVRIGEAPSADLYDCRPWLNGSVEVCEVELTVPTAIHLMVNGWVDSSDFTLRGAAQPE